MDEFRLITLDPGHFHAGLIQKEMYAGVSPRVAVYAPLGSDLTEHLNRIARFNLRPENPTCWELDIHAAPDFLERMLAERPGNIVVLSGRNRAKIGHIRAALDAGLHVLADKPWVIRSADLPALQDALAVSQAKGLVAYDIMTERYEITSILQRELVNDSGTFGAILPGSEHEPAVYMESVHHILKLVAGVPNLRPAWFFDIHEQGEALADVGTHLVDLVQWTLYPDAAIDWRADTRVLQASRWPTTISAAQFRQVTGEAGDGLDYYCNTRVSYSLRGIQVKLDVLWRWEAPAGTGDTHLAVYRGSKSRIEVRQGREENYRPELYVVPGEGGVKQALAEKIRALAQQYPGVAIEDRGAEVLVTIPDRYRVGHEAHFAQVTNRFFEHLKHSRLFPAWENPNMLAKYFVSTKGVEMSQP
ncbi:putative oxidoreductase [Candidatus Sulfopaludibacter sp. SbA4]|nr:putative oxidoreductase [Candidatus Sulfopaludibacter sp. SbA4]